MWYYRKYSIPVYQHSSISSHQEKTKLNRADDAHRKRKRNDNIMKTKWATFTELTVGVYHKHSVRKT